MRIFFYQKANERIRPKLPDLLGELPPGSVMERFQTLEALINRLGDFLPEPPVAILWIGSSEDLFDVLSFRNLFDGLRIILVLPNRSKETIAEAHHLRPRFIAFEDEDCAILVAVLKKMASSQPGKRIPRYAEKNE